MVSHNVGRKSHPEGKRIAYSPHKKEMAMMVPEKILGEKFLRDHRQQDGNVAIGGIGNLARLN